MWHIWRVENGVGVIPIGCFSLFASEGQIGRHDSTIHIEKRSEIS